IEAPWLGARIGLAAVTTEMPVAHDGPLAPRAHQPKRWRKGGITGVGGLTGWGKPDPFANRAFAEGPHPFEDLKRVERPTTYIDEAAIPRVPKRTDMFARSQFGDMGPANQKAATGGHYAKKAAPSMAQRRMLGAFTLLQDGEPAAVQRRMPPDDAANMVKAASYFMGIDAMGISRCPDWAWYSHDATGTPIEPPHDQAISMIVDQGFETTSGSSGDDWISVVQSMRAYLRFSLLGGVLATFIRSLGYSAKAHTVIDGDVLQPPLLLLSGLGEVSRIGEVILNPFLGPRLKSGVVTTDLPMTHDKPIDFGLQRFCETCNKCARECPSGAITAGPKLMFNGYETWKSDSQRCTTYRITHEGGAMCGRCMKTCPWNLEGLFAEAPFRWAAMNVPSAAPVLAKLDDLAGRGGLNPVKKWWWDLELAEDGGYRAPRAPVNVRDLQPDLEVRAEDQTLAVYPAPLTPHPYPYPYPMDREAGIAAYRDMIPAEAYRAKRAAGETGAWDHRLRDHADSPVLPVIVSKVEEMAEGVTKYEFRRADGQDLPAWEAGAHLDIVVAPEFLRQYSMSGDPARRDIYQIGVLREDQGRGGSALLHRIFTEGRRVFISHPVNHFPLVEDASETLLMGAGIGITPLIPMAHRLHALGRPFVMHYSIRSRAQAGFLDDLSSAPWASLVHLHVAAEGGRLDPSALRYPQDGHLYTCGPDGYMAAIRAAALASGMVEDHVHAEHFALPDEPEWKNHPFVLRLADGRELSVAPEQSAAEVLNAHGVPVDVKCSDGLCGICQCGYLSGEVEHRDYVLSRAQRSDRIILCRSRAAEPDGVITLDL
ncbi:MAG: reductive dehalogenase, partial [Shimia sp.]